MSTALRAAQKSQAQSLYRRSLKNVLSWAVNRELFWAEVREEREGESVEGARRRRRCSPHALTSLSQHTHTHTPHTGREDPGRV